MIFKIHYIIKNTPDDFIVSGESILDIQTEVKTQLHCRGIDPDKCECWSEKISD